MGDGVLVEARGLWFRYPGQAGWLLRGASAALRRGEIAAVVGPNGAGKTTLLKLMAGLRRPARGCVCIDGASLWDVGEAERLAARRRLVYLHEDPVMLRGSVLENVAAGLLLRGAPRRQALARAREALEELGLSSYADAKARSLSRGLRHLVAVARALALSPEGLLLDEPFAHLDRAKRRLLARLLARLAEEGRAVAVVTHDTYLASRLARRVILVEGGRVAEGGRELLEEASGV